MVRTLSRLKAWWPASRKASRQGALQEIEDDKKYGKSLTNTGIDLQMSKSQHISNQRIVAFLGPAGSGRTVVAALVKHTLSTAWVPQSRGRWDARTECGHDEINSAIRELRQGRFPPSSAKGAYPPLKISMYRMKKYPSKFKMTIRDTQGEDYYGRLSAHGNGDGINGLITHLLEGNRSYIVYATRYILIIDCAKAEWQDAAMSQAANALTAIQRIKGKMGNLDADGRLITPIALAFTKADALPSCYRDLPAADLAGKCRGLVPILPTICPVAPACFKLHASVGSNASCGQNRHILGGTGAKNGTVEAPRQPLPKNRKVFGIDYSAQEYYRLIDWASGRHDPDTGTRRA